MIYLNDSLLIGKGAERLCYRHPEKDHCCIKIKYSAREGKRSQSEAEYDYYTWLERQGIDWSNLARCHGWVKTNLGAGLVFDYIVDEFGNPARTLKDSLTDESISRGFLLSQLDFLLGYLLKNRVMICDLTLDNIVLKYSSSVSGYHLVIVDGIGNRDFFSFLTNRFRFLAVRKIKRKWQRSMAECISILNSKY